MTLGRRGKLGLVLSGGGARGAYQAGVLLGISEIAAEIGIKNPFQVVTGVSAGAVNAAGIVAWPGSFNVAAKQVVKNWETITVSDVFRTDVLTAGRLGVRFLVDTALGSLKGKTRARSLLDTSPLRHYLEQKIPFAQFDRTFRPDGIHHLALTAMSYSSSYSVTFIQGLHEPELWDRSRRKIELTKIGVEHVMASSAIPIFFPPVAVGEEYYGDGCLRNTAPLSPAIHLGADKIIVVGVRRADQTQNVILNTASPSLARVTGVILNALLMDALEFDMERLDRINKTVELVPESARVETKLHKVDYLWLRPSRDVGELAGTLYEKLPSVIRYLVAGLGSQKESAELTSYLLFDPSFCNELIKLGYQDALSQMEDIVRFISE